MKLQFDKVKRGLHGMSRRARVIALLLAAALVLTLLYFIVIRPAYNDAIQGQSSGQKVGNLFPRHKREDILSFEFHTRTGEEFSIGRTRTSTTPTEEDVEAFIDSLLKTYGQDSLTEELLTDKLGYKVDGLHGQALVDRYRQELLTSDTLKEFVREQTTFILTQEERAYTWLTVNAERLSTLTAAAGAVYIYNTVITTNPDNADALEVVDAATYAEKLALYGLADEDTAWIRLNAADGKTYKILIGDLDATGRGYYVALEGGDVIGTTNTLNLGQMAESTAASFLDCRILTTLDNKYAYAYSPQFSLYDTVRLYAGTQGAADVTLRAGDCIGITYTMEVEGRVGGEMHMYNLPLDAEKSGMPQGFIDLFLGRGLGDCDLSYEMTFTEEDKDFPSLAGKTVRFRISSVDYLAAPETERFTISHIGWENVGDGADPTHPLDIYKFVSPSSLTRFLPDSSAAMTALENLAQLEGTVVKLGLIRSYVTDSEGTVVGWQLNEETMEQYGLWARRIEVRIPYYEGKDPSENDPVYSLRNVLYVSQVMVDSDGTRFYYIGSGLYDLVARVSEEQLAFVEDSVFSWTNHSVVRVKLDDVQKMTFTWNYGPGLSGTYVLEFERVTVTEGTKKKTETTVHVTASDGKKSTFIYNDFTNFFNRFLYMEYQGELTEDLTETEKQALLADADRRALALTFELTGGQRVEMTFSPYSLNRCCAALDGEATFYVYGKDLRTVAENFLRLLAGEPVDKQGWY